MGGNNIWQEEEEEKKIAGKASGRVRVSMGRADNGRATSRPPVVHWASARLDVGVDASQPTVQLI